MELNSLSFLRKVGLLPYFLRFGGPPSTTVCGFDFRALATVGRRRQLLLGPVLYLDAPQAGGEPHLADGHGGLDGGGRDLFERTPQDRCRAPELIGLVPRKDLGRDAVQEADERLELFDPVVKVSDRLAGDAMKAKAINDEPGMRWPALPRVALRGRRRRSGGQCADSRGHARRLRRAVVENEPASDLGKHLRDVFLIGIVLLHPRDP